MKTFQISGIENRIYFENLNRIPAEEELSNVLKDLKAAGCKISKAKAAGLDNIYLCSLDEMEFKVYYTGEETFVHCENGTDEIIRILGDKSEKMKRVIGKCVKIVDKRGREWKGKAVEMEGPEETESGEPEIGINFAGGISMFPESELESIEVVEK